jgi:protein SCO1/2
MKFSLTVIVALLLSCTQLRPAQGARKLPKELKGVTIAEQLGKMVPLDTPFVDHTGKATTLRALFAGELPVLLTLNYYRCRTLCNLQLNALLRGMRELGWKIGEKYKVVTISINPKEGPKLATKKRTTYLGVLDQGEVPWTFLTGKKVNIDRVANAVGFKYKYLPKEGEYAHPAAIFALSPKGKIARYLYGVQFPKRQLKFALVDASEGRVGSTIDRILLSCFHYNPKDGQYTPFAFGIMRLGGSLTLLVLVLLLGFFWRRERKKAREQRASDAEAEAAGAR